MTVVLVIVLCVLAVGTGVACHLVEAGRRVDALVEDVRHRAPGLVLAAPAAAAGPDEVLVRFLLGAAALAGVVLLVVEVVRQQSRRQTQARHGVDDDARHVDLDPPPAPDHDGWGKP